MTADKHTGKVLDDRYELIRHIDEGGMGSVYLGRHIKIGRKAAVKFLHAALVDQEDVVKRFYREAQAASSIEHPNIIDIFDVGVAEWGEPYLVMEYLSGETLDSVLKRKEPISLAAACAIMEPALRALSAAHEQGIVHRDIKPENIFIVCQPDMAPMVKLIDFGISKFVEEDTLKLTRTGTLLGTPSYMSPEQARGKGLIDHRVDIFSLGVIFYRMLAGDLPFLGESYNDLIFTILTESYRDPLEVNPDFPTDALPIVDRLLKKEADERYPSALAVLSALEQLEAFADRHDAMEDLVWDISTDNFATGDLGEAISPKQAMAETVLAGISADSRTVSVTPSPPDAKKTVSVTPEPALSSDEKKTVSVAPTPQIEKTDTSSNESMDTPDVPRMDPLATASDIPAAINEPSDEWVMSAGTMPRETRKLLRRSSRPYWMIIPITILLSLGLFYASGLWQFSTTPREDSNTHRMAQDPVNPIEQDSSVETDSYREGETAEMNASKGRGGHSTDASTDVATDASTDVATDKHHQSDDGVEDSSGEKHLSSIGVESEKRNEHLSRQKSEPLPAADNNKASKTVMKDTETEIVPSVPTEENGSATPVDTDISLDDHMDDNAPDAEKPLSPAEVNRLISKKDSKISNCYDMARILVPHLEGILELRISVEGDDIRAKVLSNQTENARLARCVIRAIDSVSVPPNNGELVEIDKSYNFTLK